MIKRSLLFLLIIYSTALDAQTIKTDVLVVGSSASGVAAAIQCARSKVKTVLADDGFKISGATAGNEMVTLDMNSNIPSGIWGEFQKHIREVYSKTAGYDTTVNAPLKFEPGMGTSILKKISDTVKNLTVQADTKFISIKKDGDRWEVSFTQNGKTLTVKARVVIDATENGAVVIKAGGTFHDVFDSGKERADSKLYRTAIATWHAIPPGILERSTIYAPIFYPASFLPLKAALVKGADNILVTEKAMPGEKNIDWLPLQLQFGQGVGATAAFCAFFKTTTQHLNVRIIQGEILDFKGYLRPFSDVPQNNPAWRAIQQLGASGLLEGEWQTQGNFMRFLFKPDSSVKTAGIAPILKEIYTRAFLWFNKERPREKFTVGNTLSFISEITLTDPTVLNKSMQRAWKNQYKFQSDFDVNRPISRIEFAVLANRFLNPFARTVDLGGRLVN